MRIFIALKNYRFGRVWNPQPLGPVASTLTTTPPMRHRCFYGEEIIRFLGDTNSLPRLKHLATDPLRFILILSSHGLLGL
jgi:hypothetical protein